MAVKCFYHKRRDAVGACVNCGKLICADCEVTLKKKIYCNPCVEELFGEKETAAASAPSAPPVPAAVEVAPAEEVAQPPPRAPKKAVAAAKAEIAAATTAENTSGQGKGAVIPPEIRGWNWGAFLMNWMWGIGNKVGIALLTFILGPIMAIILGVKGNEWAWRNKTWKSVEHFKKTQRAWTWAGVALFCVPIVLAVLVMALSGQSEPTTLKWKEQQTIKQPLTANMAGQDVMLGSLETQQVEVKLPGTAFQQPAQVTVKNAKKAPAVPSAEFTPLGALIEIDTGELPARLYELATITFKIDKASMESHPDSGSYWVAYYTGSEWEYIKPDEVNLAEGTISIQTDHFSLWGWGEITVDKYVEEYTKNKAVAEYAQEQVDEKVQEALGNYVKDMCGKLGVKDELKSELLAGVFTDKEYGNLIKSMKDEDTGAFTENLAKLLGNNMQRILDKKDLDKIGKIKNPLGTTLEKADDVATFATALGYAYEENYTEAAKILGEYALKKSIYGQAFLALKEGGEYLAEDLTNRLFEQSYQVYSKGASEPIWGFIPSFGMNNIPAGQFGLVWDQSHKVRQVLIDRYKKTKGFDEGQAEAAAREYLENLFKEREKREAEIAQKQKELNELLGIFREGAKDDLTLEDFLFPLEKSWWGITTRLKCPPEGKLDDLLEMIDIIKKETGTTKVGGTVGPGVLQTADLLKLASQLIIARQATGGDPNFRTLEYESLIGEYKLRIVPPQEIDAGKGITGPQYSFTAEGKNVGDWPHYTWSVNGKEVPNSDSESFPRAFTSPGDYTLKCKVSWTSGMSGQFPIKTEAVATLTFRISDQAELKISVSPAMPSGKGAAGTSYVFTATGKAIPADAVYTWTLNYAVDEKVQSNKTNTLTGALKWPGEYTLKCLAKWKEKSSSGQQVDREVEATPLAFAIPLTISRNPLNGEAGNSYTFTVGDGASPPGGAYYQWSKDGTAQTGKDATNTIAFPDKGTYTIEAKLVATGSGQVIAQGQATANIKAATPIPPPTQQVPLEAKGSLNIGSVPAGADIYINGQKQGYQTNVNFTNVEAGNYTVVLKKAGYKDFSATATVAEGRITEMLAKLEAVESEPAPAPAPSPTPQPTQPAKKTPQQICDCYAKYLQTDTKGWLNSCNLMISGECISVEVRITKPWMVSPDGGACWGSYEVWYITRPSEKAWCYISATGQSVTLDDAEEECQKLGK